MKKEHPSEIVTQCYYDPVKIGSMKHLYAAGTWGKVYEEDLATLKEAKEISENLRNGRTKTVVVLRVTLTKDGTAYDPRYKVLGSSGTWTKWKEVKQYGTESGDESIK